MTNETRINDSYTDDKYQNKPQEEKKINKYRERTFAIECHGLSSADE